MKVQQESEERPLAWTAILADTPVQSSDEVTVGAVREVLGSEAEDIFHGVVITSGSRGHEVLIPAEKVASITDQQLTTSLSADEIRDLVPYVEERSYQLGFVGLIRKRLGWVDEAKDRR